MADIRVPGVGPVSKKWVVIVLAGSAVTIGYVVLRKRSQANAAAAASSSTDTSPGSNIDPLTGDIAGSAQDQADLAAMQAGGYGNLGLDGLGGGYGGYVASPPAASTIPGAGGFTTNGEWAQQAETDLGGLGISQTALSAALGKYLTAQPLSASDQGLVDQAIAEEGYPPVSGPGGYPPAMKTSPVSSPSPPSPPAATVTVPHVDGMRAVPGIGEIQAAGLVANVNSGGPINPVHEYQIWSQTPGGGTKVAKGSTVDLAIKIIA